MEIIYSSRAHSITRIRDHVIRARQENARYRVLDLGGSRVGWTSDLADCIVDLAEDSTLSFDLSCGWQWLPLIDLVRQQGLFDLCICTHTLEDLYNPVAALEYMPLVAHEGFISTPSISTELSHVQSKQFKGYLHHRWLFGGADRIELWSKLPFLEIYPAVDHVEAQEEIVYHWRDRIAYHVASRLGPDTDSLIKDYETWIDENLKLIKITGGDALEG